MMTRGSPPYLECSTHGYRALSAFVACPKSLGGRSIEEAYQAMKKFEDGSTGLHWRAAKGRRAVNMPECIAAYTRWWAEYIAENPHLLTVLKQASGLSDKFGREGSVCQADVLWKIRNAQ